MHIDHSIVHGNVTLGHDNSLHIYGNESIGNRNRLNVYDNVSILCYNVELGDGNL